MNKYDAVIVGGGSAGRTAVETLVAENPDLQILFLDAEGPLPYKRTKISKSVAKGFDNGDFAVLPWTWYRENSVVLRTGTRVVQLNSQEHLITLESEGQREVIAYGGLILALGAKPRVLPGADSSDRCFPLWTLAHGQALRSFITPGTNVAVVGMGVLGVEAAAQISAMEGRPVLIGKADRPLARYLDHPTAAVLEDALQDAGMHLVKNRVVTALRQDGTLMRILTGQEEFSADAVVYAIGGQANIDLALRSGLRVDRGILVDDHLRTSAPGIWAAGDCAQHPDGTVTGLWHSAEHQGRNAALSFLGRAVVNDNPPYRLKCEILGGFWFSAGPVNAPLEDCDEILEWKHNGILWRPRFRNNALIALVAAAPCGMSKTRAKSAQRAVLERWDPAETQKVLLSPID